MEDPLPCRFGVKMHIYLLFTLPRLIHPRSADGAWAKWSGAVLAGAYGALVVAHSLLDWPLRRLTSGRAMSTIMLVPSARQTYDRQLAAALWDAAEEAAGLRPCTPRRPVRGERAVQQQHNRKPSGDRAGPGVKLKTAAAE